MDVTIIKLFLAVMLISIVAALVGTFTFLQKKALISDALAHAVLPGIVIGFMLTGHLTAWIVLFSALVAGWFALQSMNALNKQTTFHSDALIAVILSSFLALGLCLLSYTQMTKDFARSGLNYFLFGKITAINWNDLIMMGGITIATIVFFSLKWKVLIGRSFDPTYLRTKGFNTRTLDIAFNIFIILSVAISVQAIGVVLTSALLIIPVTCARMFTYSVYKLVIYSLIIALIASISGTTMSIVIPHTPTGPAMVFMLAILFGIGLIVKLFNTKSQ